METKYIYKLEEKDLSDIYCILKNLGFYRFQVVEFGENKGEIIAYNYNDRPLSHYISKHDRLYNGCPKIVTDYVSRIKKEKEKKLFCNYMNDNEYYITKAKISRN